VKEGAVAEEKPQPGAGFTGFAIRAVAFLYGILLLQLAALYIPSLRGVDGYLASASGSLALIFFTLIIYGSGSAGFLFPGVLLLATAGAAMRGKLPRRVVIVSYGVVMWAAAAALLETQAQAATHASHMLHQSGPSMNCVTWASALFAGGWTLCRGRMRDDAPVEMRLAVILCLYAATAGALGIYDIHERATLGAEGAALVLPALRRAEAGSPCAQYETAGLYMGDAVTRPHGAEMIYYSLGRDEARAYFWKQVATARQPDGCYADRSWIDEHDPAPWLSDPDRAALDVQAKAWLAAHPAPPPPPPAPPYRLQPIDPHWVQEE
jgi:hypothetical protein